MASAAPPSLLPSPTQAGWAAIAFGTFFRCFSVIIHACFLSHVSLCENGLQLCL